ncbi:bifunctional diaminohydroxyphosphoribosylaminopyrimidine deaminase/5-amino-6-(5-phosphoribosylamino)uracil reductase RibD [Acuticoccus mangrovi]|uniref:Riboflavin biosynthesis protein RibD n=1 Tax=Acuticoccus mangrovi TaxID=2796142 RepID=A0A934ISW3_9HYPH|nr:bifunctional diaminohydroxyphosphoribosylaminopyrimidine deaminase/5-amino-6-(5-phosphoribosylamino)uracil reductase RibD [Acuticoccus mangrovi]
MTSEAEDRRFMAAALAIGRQGQGRTAPNPPVGAVLVRQGPLGPVIVGAGRSGDGGRPHAERYALAEAGGEAEGATLYVSLEPCSHFGRTPPCADALVGARIGRAVIAIEDPNPMVSGKGTEKLREAGIPLTFGVRADEARRDLAGHITRMTLGRPHVRLKMAVDAEGAVGRRGAGQVAITGALANTRTHLLRAECDAIAVGVGTVVADDPVLTCRLPGLARWSPVRVVFDSDANVPPTARLFADAATIPVIVFVGEGADAGRIAGLDAAGAEVERVGRGADGRIDLAAALALLAARGITTLLVEGGPVLQSALLVADLVDAVHRIAAPTTIDGDVMAPIDAASLAERFEPILSRRYGDDHWTEYWRDPCSQA